MYLGSLNGGNAVGIAETQMAAVYGPPNWLLIPRQDALVAIPSDAARATVTGDPVVVALTISVSGAYARTALTASNTGVMVYASRGASQRRQLLWRDRTGRVLGSAYNLFQKLARGAAGEQIVLATPEPKTAYDMSPEPEATGGIRAGRVIAKSSGLWRCWQSAA